MNIFKYKHMHFVGIKGVGMTSLSLIAKDMGKSVSGSDVDEQFITQKVLDKNKIKIFSGFAKKNIDNLLDKYKKQDILVITTGAHGGCKNPEVILAKKIGISVVSHAEALGRFMNLKKTRISVAGTHGKTTTTAMLAYLLTKMGRDPSFAVGTGMIGENMPPGRWGSGNIFIAEADEYATDPIENKTPRFLWQNPNILIITNIEFDHPDVFADIKAVRSAFSSLINKVPREGRIIASFDSDELRKVLKNSNKKIITYGFSPRADYQISNYKFAKYKAIFNLSFGDKNSDEVELESVSGRHNAANATAAILGAVEAGISWQDSARLISEFPGSQRRLEFLGGNGYTLLFDDYAHHPTEIKATLKNIKEIYPDYEIICVFQPHTYSRTKALFGEFSKSFFNADKVIITDIFASAREKKDPSISSKKLADKISKYQRKVIYCPKLEDVVEYLLPRIGSKQIILTMGAGDVYKIHEKLINNS